MSAEIKIKGYFLVVASTSTLYSADVHITYENSCPAIPSCRS